IDPDNYRHDFSDGPHPLFYGPEQTRPNEKEWGSIGGWAWALSNIRVWLENDDLVDASRLAVIGHSRLGKTALWAGAQDQNFRMVVSNNSGCGGAALYRRCYGERIHHMLKPVGYWFCRNHARYARRESELPVDQHMLMAAIAPRALYVASATEDRWADPKGEFLALKHAAAVYGLYGFKGLPGSGFPPSDEPVTGGRLGYHVRTGRHDVTAYDWKRYLDFADLHLKPVSR
ncbi:MAG: acetylxylan esterase, partial [Planctomycetaceae bacterium]